MLVEFGKGELSVALICSKLHEMSVTKCPRQNHKTLETTWVEVMGFKTVNFCNCLWCIICFTTNNNCSQQNCTEFIITKISH